MPRVPWVQSALQHPKFPQCGVDIPVNVLIDEHLYVVYEEVFTDAYGCELDEDGEEPGVGLAARVGEDGRPEQVREALVEAVAREEQVPLQEIDQSVQGNRRGRGIRGRVLLSRHHTRYLVRKRRFVLIDDSFVSHLRQI